MDSQQISKEQENKRNLNIGCGVIFGIFLLIWAASEINSCSNKLAAMPDPKVEVARRQAEKKKDEDLAAMPASEHIKAGELALSSLRSNDTRPPILLSGQKAPKPVITDAQWNAARNRLNLIKTDQPEYSKAQQLLKAMAASDKRKAVEDAKIEAIAAMKARKSYAVRLEERFIEKRINADVKTFGRDSTTLWIKWALASKVTANDLGKSGVLEEAEKLGFKTVEFHDGYNFATGWKLNP